MSHSLKQDIKIYKDLKKCAISHYKRKNYEKSLTYIFIATTFAWRVHLGIWCDNELEHILYDLGLRIRQNSHHTFKKSSDRKHFKIAYIASTLYDIGGHSNVLKHWVNILNERFNNQALYLTNISNYPLFYPDTKKFLKNNGLEIYELPYNIDFIERIKKLVQLLERKSPDIIILLIQPNDIILIPALSALSNKPLTFFFNHADNGFWLGKKIIDRLIEFRVEGAKYSRKFRNITQNQFIIPLTTNIKPLKISKSEFGIPENSTLSISVGGFSKVGGNFEFNYFKIIEKILKKFTNHYHMFITNATSEDILKEYRSIDLDIKKRFVITGPFSDLRSIYGIADFLISTFPIGGGLVRLEAMACGLPIVAYHNNRCPLICFDDALPPNYFYLASNEIEIINFSSQFIKNPKLRKAVSEQLYDFYIQNMSPKIVKYLLNNIIKGDISNNILFDPHSSKEIEIKYDEEYLYRVFYKSPHIKGLLDLSINFSLFSFKQRIRFYIEALKRNEFKSSVESFQYAITSFMGYYIFPLYKLIKKFFL